MLDWAINHEEELNKKYRNIIMKPKYKYYQTSYSELSVKIRSSTWEGWNMVSLHPITNTIIGYFSISFDREINCAEGLGVINLGTKANIYFSKDFYAFLQSIFQTGIHKLKFGVVIGNPIEKMYDRMIKKYGGRIVGIETAEWKTYDGQLCDLKRYEIMKSDYDAHRRKYE